MTKTNASGTTPLDALMRERRLDCEDYAIQIEAAQRSMERGYFATAKAELRGAIEVLGMMEKRCGHWSDPI